MNNELASLQAAVGYLYGYRGYSTDRDVLFRGLVEEVGEIGAALNDADPRFVKRDGRTEQDMQHEIEDALVYLLALANSLDLKLDISHKLPVF